MWSQVAAVIGLLVLTGCGGRILQSDGIPADKKGFSYVSIISDPTTGGTGADASFARQPGEVIVGHEHFSEGRRSHQHYFRGAAHFDLGRISAIPSKVVTAAVLQYRHHASDVRDGAGVAEPFPLLTSCATELMTAEADWRAGPTTLDGVVINDKTPFIGDPVRPLPTVPGAGGGTLYSIDVTTLVQRWVARPEQNLGVILRGAVEPPQARDNSRCTSRYSEFVLRVDYTVFTK